MLYLGKVTIKENVMVSYSNEINQFCRWRFGMRLVLTLVAAQPFFITNGYNGNITKPHCLPASVLAKTE